MKKTLIQNHNCIYVARGFWTFVIIKFASYIVFTLLSLGETELTERRWHYTNKTMVIQVRIILQKYENHA